jgi:hypothetical protein
MIEHGMNFMTLMYRGLSLLTFQDLIDSVAYWLPILTTLYCLLACLTLFVDLT